MLQGQLGHGVKPGSHKVCGILGYRKVQCYKDSWVMV